MTEIMEITKQPEYQFAPLWVSDEGKVNINSTDIVDQVLLGVTQKLNTYKYYWSLILGRQIHVNAVPVDDHKPILVSIGPNHQDTIKTDVIELHKLKYLRDLVKRTNTNVEKLLRANLEYFLSECVYSNRSPPYDVLIETWILDGCFIIELFLKNDEQEDSLLLKSERVLYALNRDLILPDNQMPGSLFIILIKACSPSEISDQDIDEKLQHFYRLARKFLEGIVPNQKLYQSLDDIDHQFEDLRSIVYDGLKWPLPHQANNKVEDGNDEWNLVQSATELEEFGVEFKMIEMDNFVDIKFTNNGVLEIPRIRIRYGTPYCIKVLLEYEQSHRQSRYLNNYLWFMNSLVKSPNDVQLLRQKRIINNLSELADDAAIHKFLKDLYYSLMISHNNFSYIQVCRDLNLHCSNRRNAWMAKLKRDYFNSPWAVISVFGASLLLIFTIAQTVFSAASYYNQS